MDSDNGHVVPEVGAGGGGPYSAGGASVWKWTKNQMNSEKQSRKAVAAPSVDNYHEGIGPELGARALMLFSLSTHTHYYSC